MDTKITKQSVTPGRQVTRFSRDEVSKAMFVACYGRTPTATESRRLCVFIDEGRDHGSGWELRLIYIDELPADLS